MNNIPKIAHFIYTMNSPISWLQTLSIDSFRKYNPDWKIILYMIKQTPDKLAPQNDVPDYTGPDYMDSMLRRWKFDELQIVDLDKWNIRKDIHGIQASDIIRMRLMRYVGGVYSDFDMLWTAPMNAFFNYYSTSFETAVCIHPNGHYNMSNVVSEPDGPFMRAFGIAQDNVGDVNNYQVFNSVLFRKLWPDKTILKAHYPRVMLIDYETFYPYSVYELQKLYKENDLKVLDWLNVSGVHWFCGHELSKDYINKEDYKRPCSMTKILKREGWI